MRIIIDGDACPVIDQTETIAKEYNIELLLFCDYNHEIELNYGEVIKVDQSNQSVDMKILNNCNKGDIIITDDYGLASLVLGKQANAINSRGKIFTNKNIEHLLMQRHINQKIRRAGGRHQTTKKRNSEDDQKFMKRLKKLIKQVR